MLRSKSSNRVVSCFRLKTINTLNGHGRRLWIVILDLNGVGSPTKAFDEDCLGEACLKQGGVLTPTEIEFVLHNAPTINVKPAEYNSWKRWEKHNLDNG